MKIILLTKSYWCARQFRRFARPLSSQIFLATTKLLGVLFKIILRLGIQAAYHKLDGRLCNKVYLGLFKVILFLTVFCMNIHVLLTKYKKCVICIASIYFIKYLVKIWMLMKECSMHACVLQLLRHIFLFLFWIIIALLYIF